MPGWVPIGHWGPLEPRWAHLAVIWESILGAIQLTSLMSAMGRKQTLALPVRQIAVQPCKLRAQLFISAHVFATSYLAIIELLSRRPASAAIVARTLSPM